MFSWFRGLIEQLAWLLARAAFRELEAEAAAQSAQRQAELLRQAARYEAEGLPQIAAALRQQVEALGSPNGNLTSSSPVLPERETVVPTSAGASPVHSCERSPAVAEGNSRKKANR